MIAASDPHDTEFDPTLSAARMALYRFASLTLLDPLHGSHRRLAANEAQESARAAAEWFRHEPRAAADSLALGEHPLNELWVESVLSRLPATEDALNREYEATFGLLDSGDVPVCETDYIGAKFTFQRSQNMADVAGYYRAFGLEPSSQHPQRPDHVSLELEFMAVLIDLERRAAAIPAFEQLELCRNAQRRFLSEHLAWWTPVLTRLLGFLHPDGFYAAASRFVAALLPAERALLKVSVPQQAVEMSRIETPDECDGCLLRSNETF